MGPVHGLLSQDGVFWWPSWANCLSFFMSALVEPQSKVPLLGSIPDLLTASIFLFLYYENFCTQSSILQYIYIGHHR